MATEILVNDGGAPARILPFTAGSTISAGDYCVLTAADEQVDKVSATDTLGLGVALTAATSGNVASVISGKGVVLRTLVSGTAATAGVLLATQANGYLIKTTSGANAVATCLEDASATTALIKVLML